MDQLFYVNTLEGDLARQFQAALSTKIAEISMGAKVSDQLAAPSALSASNVAKRTAACTKLHACTDLVDADGVNDNTVALNLLM